MEDGQPEVWLPLAEAASRLGTTVDALRHRIRLEQVRARKDNHGRWTVLVDGELSASGTLDHDQPSANGQLAPGQPPASGPLADERATARLLLELEEAREAGERWRLAAEEARLEAASLRARLEERDRLEAALAEARRPWLARVIEGLRRR